MSEGINLLSAICRHGSSQEFRELQEDLFVDDDEYQLYQYIGTYYRRYGRFPSVGTIEENIAIDIPETDEPLQYYKDQVHDRRRYNVFREQFLDLRTAANPASLDLDAARQVAENMVRGLRGTSAQYSLLSTGDLVEEVLAEYERNHQSPGFSGVTTGWGGLDEQSGGYQNGDLIVWVARPGMGKTWLLIHQAHAAWMDGRSALFVSMEMTLPQVGRRFVAYHQGIDPDYLRKGQLGTYGERHFRNNMGALVADTSLNWYAGGMSKRAADVDMLIQELSPDIVYVDGIYLMQPANVNSRMGRYERAAYMVDELKTIAYQRNRPVVVTTQFGREAGKGGKHGSMENIGYTDAFSTHASMIFGIKNGKRVVVPELTGFTEESEDESVVLRPERDTYPYREIEIMKGREGEQGSFGCHYSFGPTNFQEAPLADIREEEGAGTADAGIARPQ